MDVPSTDRVKERGGWVGRLSRGRSWGPLCSNGLWLLDESSGKMEI